jgi:C2 domain
MFGKADPYCKLTVGGQRFETRPHSGGGKSPVWNEEHAFDISTEKDMEIEVLDKVSFSTIYVYMSICISMYILFNVLHSWIYSIFSQSF